MNEKDPWDRFWGSGRIEDYLMYAGSTNRPMLGTTEMIAMNNAVELSGMGGVNTFGLNNMPAIARQDEMNGQAAVTD